MTNMGRMLNLPPQKRELLNQLLRQRTGTGDGIQRRPAGMSVVPASFGQRRIWFLDQLEPGLPLYQISSGLAVQGHVDSEVLDQSVNALVERHESLRTAFSETDGELFQVISDHVTIRSRILDFTTLPSGSRMGEVARCGSADAREPFDLAIGPLLRTTLIGLEEHRSILLLTVHHIVSDGWSMKILLQELSVLYRAFLNGEQSPLPDLPIQYADYALWQRAHLTEDLVATDLAYWRNQLEGSSRLCLPVDYSVPKRTHKGAREFFQFGISRTQQLNELSRQSGNTVFMTLLAAFQVLLSRYSGQDDIVIGTPVAARHRVETEGLIGFLLNTVCMRTSLRGDPDFVTLLERVRHTALGAYSHQELPFEKVVQHITAGIHNGESRLFNVMFVLQPGRTRTFVDETDVAPSPESLDWEFESGTAKFDLTLSMAETGAELVGAFEYSTDLFQSRTVRRMVEHFMTLIDSIVAEPNTPITKLRMLSIREEAQVLRGWNELKTPFREDARVERLVAEQAAQSPIATAIICDECEITYGSLCDEANQIAHYLLSHGVRPRSRVGIFLGRDRRLLPALLGTWSAGCTYVPFDTTSPSERIRYLLDDARVAAVLTEQHLVERFPLNTTGLLCLDTDEELISRHNANPPDVKASPEDPAYIIYTSGSTGEPKGVVVSHRSVINYLTWINKGELGLSHRLLPAISSITFDASLKQLFAPLLRGDLVWLIPEKVATNVRDLTYAIGKRGDFTLNCVPWLWSAILDTLSEQDFEVTRCLKRLLLGGEDVDPELLKRTFARFPDLEVWNLYGPTEATANATVMRLYPGAPISIGRPVANCTVRVLDSHRQLVPIGITGELHLGGIGIAQGYWDRKELTEERFIPDPFAAVAGLRLYKTGDLVRYREDGTLKFEGRMDRQLKVHGYRIEPAEIETVLSTHSGVGGVAVVLGGEPSERHLLAYVEAKEGKNLSASEIRRFASKHLPAFMIPARFVSVDRLPRNAHGKLDRAKLPPQTFKSNHDTAPFVAARDQYEEAIAEILETVLKVDFVGVETSFFELGGHSLLAIQAMSRIRETFGVEVPLRVLFETPTVEALANIVRQSREHPQKRSVPTIQRLDRGPGRVTQAADDPR